MAFEINVRNLVDTISGTVKFLKTTMLGSADDLSGLTTLDKSSIVAAINEAASTGGSGGGALTDGSVTNVKVADNAAISADKLADGTTNKVYTATEKTKLSGIATAATANDTDANLKSRANHTGTQTASTISDFATAALTVAPAETVTTVGSLTAGATAKAVPVDGDSLGISDSAASGILKKLTWANVKATLRSYFDTIYLHSSGDEAVAGVKTFSVAPAVPDGSFSWSKLSGTLSLAKAASGERFTCLWNSTTSKWAYNGIDITARPSARSDIFFDYLGAPNTFDGSQPTFAILGDRREDV